MAGPREDEVQFTNNPAIAAEIDREKTGHTHGDDGSDLSDNTRIEQHDEPSAAEKESRGANLDKPGTYDKVEITEEDCYDELGCKSGALPEYKTNHSPPVWNTG